MGGSTTDHYQHFEKSWPECLYDLIDNNKICIYNGGMAGYNSSQELLKLIRDVIPIKPDIVISYSGYNDATCSWFGNDRYGNKYPMVCGYLQETVKKFVDGTEVSSGFGVENEVAAEEIFLQNEQLMKGICDCLGIKFVGILQEAVFWNALGADYRPSTYEKDLLATVDKKGNVNEFYSQIDKKSPFTDWFIDGRNFMGESTELFTDACHCNTEGNRLIALQIYKIIETYLP